MIVSPVPTGQQLEVPFFPGHIYAALKPIEADKVMIEYCYGKYLSFWFFRCQLSLHMHQDQRTSSITIMNTRSWISRLVNYIISNLIFIFIIWQQCQCHLLQFGSVSELFHVSSSSFIEVPSSYPPSDVSESLALSAQESKDIKVVIEQIK